MGYVLTPKGELTPADLDGLRERLVEVLTLYFQTADDQYLPDDFASINIGLYREYREQIGPGSSRASAAKPELALVTGSPERDERLDIRFTHRVLHHPRPVAFRFAEGVYQFDAAGLPLPAGRDRTSDAKFKPTMLHSVYRRGDLKWDNTTELGYAHLPFADILGEARAPRRGFDRNVKKIKVPASCAAFAADFHEHLAFQCTYDDNLDYYPKWAAARPANANERTYDFEHLSDEYLRRNVKERKLVRDWFYLLLRAEESLSVYSLHSVSLAGRATIKSELVYSNVHQIPKTSQPDDGTRVLEPRALFFYAVEGLDTPPPRPSPKSIPVRVALTEYLVDTREMVERVNAASSLSKYMWDEWEWFAEMVKLYFPRRAYMIYTAGLETFYKEDDSLRRQLFLNGIAGARAQWHGSPKAMLEACLKELETDRNIILLVQGAPVNDHQRFVGTDGHWTYLRDTKTGDTTRLLNTDFVYNLYVGRLASTIYAQNAHLIPLCIIAAWGGVIVAGIGVLGTAAFVELFKRYMIEEGREMTSRKVFEEMLKRFRVQLIAAAAHGFLCLLPLDGRATRFARGLLRGLAIDSVETLLRKYQTLALEGPKVYRYYKIYKRVSATSRLIEKRVETLRGKLDDSAIQVLAERMESMARHLTRGVLLSFSAVGFLDRKHAEPLLQIAHALTDEPVQHEPSWDADRRRRLATLLGRGAARYVDEAEWLAQANDEKEASGRYREDRGEQIAQPLVEAEADFLGSAKNVVFYTVLIDAVFRLGAIDVTDAAKGAWAAARFLIANLRKSLGRLSESPEEAEKLGEVCGHALGGFLLDRAVFAKGTKLEKILKSKFVGKFKSDLTHGIFVPVLKVIFHHYIRLVEQVSELGEMAAAQWNSSVDDVFNRTESGLFLSDREKRIKLENIPRFLPKLEELITSTLWKLSRAPDFRLKLAALAASATEGRFPTLESVIRGDSGAAPLREALLFVMLSQLRAALRELVNATSLVFEPIVKGDDLALIDVFEIVGFEMDTDDVVTEELQAVYRM